MWLYICRCNNATSLLYFISYMQECSQISCWLFFGEYFILRTEYFLRKFRTQYSKSDCAGKPYLDAAETSRFSFTSNSRIVNGKLLHDFGQSSIQFLRVIQTLIYASILLPNNTAYTIVLTIRQSDSTFAVILQRFAANMHGY